MTDTEQIQWKVVKEAGKPLYHLSLLYPGGNIRVSVSEDELRSLQDAISGTLYEQRDV